MGSVGIPHSRHIFSFCPVCKELKESATELLFGGHETTASAATSLIAFLGLHHDVLQKVRKELQVKVCVFPTATSQEQAIGRSLREVSQYGFPLTQEVPYLQGGRETSLAEGQLSCSG